MPRVLCRASLLVPLYAPCPAAAGNCLQVLDALQLSRATLRKIKQNMWWAFGYNLLGLPLAAGALLPLTGLALTPSMSGGLRRCRGIHAPTHSCFGIFLTDEFCLGFRQKKGKNS